MSTTLQHVKATALTRWQALSPREQRHFTWLGLLLAAVLMWTIAIAPARHTLSDNQKRRVQMDTQQAHMLNLQAQAQALQQRSLLSRDEALRTLQSLSAHPKLQLSVQGERVSVQLKAMPAQTLATWLTQVRSQAQTLPIEAHLTRGNDPDKNTATWSGSLVLRLPNNTARTQ